MGTFEALRDYRMRERIEEFFGMDKRYFDGRRSRLWGCDALQGWQFAQFVGLGYLCRFRRMVDDVKAGLGAEVPGKPAALLRLEKGLKGWLADRSTQDIFDWFDCIETTQVETEAGRFRWSTESVARDRLFLERLGLQIANSCRVIKLLWMIRLPAGTGATRLDDDPAPLQVPRAVALPGMNMVESPLTPQGRQMAKLLDRAKCAIADG